MLKFELVFRDFTTTLRINKIELLKEVDKTEDRIGYEKPQADLVRQLKAKKAPKKYPKI